MFSGHKKRKNDIMPFLAAEKIKNMSRSKIKLLALTSIKTKIQYSDMKLKFDAIIRKHFENRTRITKD